MDFTQNVTLCFEVQPFFITFTLHFAGVTETLLDLTKLNRNDQIVDNDQDFDISEHKAVLKQPLDVNEIHRIHEEKNEIEEPPKEYDDQELPGPQDKRGELPKFHKIGQ